MQLILYIITKNIVYKKYTIIWNFNEILELIIMFINKKCYEASYNNKMLYFTLLIFLNLFINTIQMQH